MDLILRLVSIAALVLDAKSNSGLHQGNGNTNSDQVCQTDVRRSTIAITGFQFYDGIECSDNADQVPWIRDCNRFDLIVPYRITVKTGRQAMDGKLLVRLHGSMCRWPYFLTLDTPRHIFERDRTYYFEMDTSYVGDWVRYVTVNAQGNPGLGESWDLESINVDVKRFPFPYFSRRFTTSAVNFTFARPYNYRTFAYSSSHARLVPWLHYTYAENRMQRWYSFGQIIRGHLIGHRWKIWDFLQS